MAPTTVNPGLLFPAVTKTEQALWHRLESDWLLTHLANTKVKTPEIPKKAKDPRRLFACLRQRLEATAFNFPKLPAEVRVIIYDIAMHTRSAVMDGKSPALAQTCKEARNHFLENSIYLLSTTMGKLLPSRTNATSTLQPTKVCEKSKNLLRYLRDTNNFGHVKRVVITRDALCPRPAGHIFFAWLICFPDGLREYQITPLDEFREAKGGRGAGFDQQGQSTATD